MKNFVEQNKIFLALYFLFLFIGGILIVVSERGKEILYFSSIHTPFFDVFFKYITQMAELPLMILILLITLRFSYGKGLVLAINSSLIFFATYMLKYKVFDNQVRPSLFFEGKTALHFVDGVEMLRHNSFPSGHTAAAFGLFFMLSLLLNEKKWSIVFFVLALLVAISRVYLLQHFFRDVYGGSVVGVTVSVLFYFTFVRSNLYKNLTWREKALLKRNQRF